MRTKVHAWESIYQSRYVPIPRHAPTDNTSENFIGRLAREIIRITDPRFLIFFLPFNLSFHLFLQEYSLSSTNVNLVRY